MKMFHSPATKLALALGSLLALAVPAIPLVASAASAPVNSGEAKYQKQQVEVSATQTNLTKPQAPPPPKKETGPTITAEQFVSQKKAQIKSYTDAQINKMQRLIQVTQEDDPQKPDFYFRIGELYAENQRYFSDKARSMDQKIFDAPPGKKADLENEQKNYEKQGQQWLLKAVKSYIDATKYAKYQRMDEVLFKLAYLLTSVKKEEQAREFFKRLIKEYPNSKYIPDAYLSFAEYYFERATWTAR